jgi:ribonuclease T2
MLNNRIRYLIVLIGIGLILFFIISTIIYLTRRSEHRIITSDSCPRPKQYATDYDYDYTKNSKEYRNTNSSIDYFRLSLSWSPTFCHGKKSVTNIFQCQHSFGFIVHGLWPSKFEEKNNSHLVRLHPRNCRNEKEIPIEIIKKYFCLMPSEILMQAEWEKHGTCYWQKPEDYFQQINSLYLKINLPDNINEILNNQTISKRLRREYIQKSFLNRNPQLIEDYINIMMTNKGKQLKEVDFCYDHHFNHIKCN